MGVSRDFFKGFFKEFHGFLFKGFFSRLCSQRKKTKILRKNVKIAGKIKLWIFALKNSIGQIVVGTVWIQQRNFGPHTKIFPGNKCISIISFFLDTFSQRALWLDSRYHIPIQNKVDPEDQKNCWKGSLLIWMSSEHKCPFTSMSL